MTRTQPTVYQDIERCVDDIIEHVGKDIVFGLPLGLGKAPHVVNALYERARQDKSISLKIITAISLEKPEGKSDLEKRFLEPFAERLFGEYPDLQYVLDMRKNRLPENITVSEFYFKPASFLNHPVAQSNYICTNYTHACRDLIDMGINVLAQIIAKRDYDGETRYSLSCNSDMPLDIIPMMEAERAKGKKMTIVGQVNNNLPYMVNDAEVSGELFDCIVDNPELEFPLFSMPNMSISAVDHMIGFNASTLIKDDGTLQIGIGSLSDSLINSSLMRHERNDDYRALVDELKLTEKFPVIDRLGELGTFEHGLYADTEMLVHGYMSLYKAGILKRKVYDNLPIQTLVNEGILEEKITPEAFVKLFEMGCFSYLLNENDVAFLKRYGLFSDAVEYRDGQIYVDGKELHPDLSEDENLKAVIEHCLGSDLKGGLVAHGAFFLGPNSFYQSLRDLTEEQRREFNMTAVSYTNDLYGDQQLKTAQRKNARFVNSCMMMTLAGGAVSDGLNNGQVVSGVGGQYNFVSMSHELPGSRSILMLRSTRTSGGKTKSNIVESYGHITIPRHLRDLVITEYGIADLRGKSDQDVILELLKITDSRFQDDLISSAKSSGKLPANFELPAIYRNNTPQSYMSVLAKYQARGCFKPFPFGTDFTEEELVIGKALKSLKSKMASKSEMLGLLWKGLTSSEVPEHLHPYLKRMQLLEPKDRKEKLYQRLLVAELSGQVAKPATGAAPAAA